MAKSAILGPSSAPIWAPNAAPSRPSGAKIPSFDSAGGPLGHPRAALELLGLFSGALGRTWGVPLPVLVVFWVLWGRIWALREGSWFHFRSNLLEGWTHVVFVFLNAAET